MAVITGPNGSGKSHLLEAIHNGSIAVEGVRAAEPDIRLFTWANFGPENSGAADPIQLVRDRASFIRAIAEAFRQIKVEFEPRALKLLATASDTPADAAVATVRMALAGKLPARPGEPPSKSGNRGPAIPPRLHSELNNLRNQCLNALQGNELLRDRLATKANRLGKDLLSLTAMEIEEEVPISWAPIDIFQQTLSQVFATYYRSWEDNQFNGYANEKYSESNQVLSNSEFRERFGEPPWIFVNRLLAEAHLDYRVNIPAGRGQLPFEAKLINISGGYEVPFSDLSSGEKVIMSFALCVYNATDRTRFVVYPKILLFDEIDAPLHPTMTKDLLRVMEEVLVKDKGIRVLLTTHSPATVALSAEGSLYRLEKQEHQLSPIGRETAILSLTSGLISVTKSSRFVLTESQSDREVFTSMFDSLVLRGALAPSPNLIFIQASDRKDRTGGGCGQVRDWGVKLPSAGLTSVRGLIDRDTGNRGTDTIKVLSRHSIENFFFDPLIVYAVLMNEGEHLKVCDCGIQNKDYYKLPGASVEILQVIADKISAEVEKSNPALENQNAKFPMKYLCGKTIDLPNWLKEHRGHDLEAMFRETFQRLVSKKFVITRNDCSCLIDMLVNRLPDFFPEDLHQTFIELQSA